MKVLIVGGVFDKHSDLTDAMATAPEAILHAGLVARGVDCHVSGHLGLPAALKSKDWNIIHVHHASFGVFSMMNDLSDARFVYTSHDGRSLTGCSVDLRWKYLQWISFALADRAVALSPPEQQFQMRQYPLNGRSVVIPNGLPLSRFPQSVSKLWDPSVCFRILFVGQLIPLKGVDALIRAVHILRNRYKLELRLVYHNDSLEHSLKELVSRLRLQDCVQFLGLKDLVGLISEYSSAHIVALPSRAESLPTVLTEAMLCGVPILSTDVGAVAWQTGGRATLIESGSPEAIAGGLCDILHDYGAFAEKAAALRKVAMVRFAADEMVESHLALYQEIAAEKHAPRRRSVARMLQRCIGTVDLNAAIRHLYSYVSKMKVPF